MLKKILSTISTTFLLSTMILAQDVQVDVQNLLYDQNGNIIEFGEIIMTFNPNVLPVYIIQEATSCSSEISYDQQSVVYTFSPGIGVCFGEEATEFCFTIITSMGTPEECSIHFCATILACRLEEWKEGQYVRVCPSIANDEHRIFKKTNQNNQNAEPLTIKSEENKTDLLEVIVEDVVDRTSIPKKFILQKAYPNPFNNQISLELNSDQTEKAVVRLLDLTGKEVHYEIINIESGDNKLTLIPKQNLPVGTYLLHILREDGQLITTKLIKAE